MTVPIIMLVLMTAPYVLGRLLQSVTGRDFDLFNAGAVGLALLFILTGIGHFTETQSMAQMLPSWVPARVGIIYLTGILEFAIAAGFFFRRSRRLTGWVTAVMLILFFPANIYAAIHQIPQGGHAWGPVYLLLRAPLQLIICCGFMDLRSKRQTGDKVRREQKANAAPIRLWCAVTMKSPFRLSVPLEAGPGSLALSE